MMSALWGNAATRPPAVANAFYPGGEDALRQQVERLLKDNRGDHAGTALAVVAPHAGYMYSGAMAARAVAALDPSRLERVILLGPSHHASFAGGALPAAKIDAFATPLGEVALDRDALAALRRAELFDGPASAHDREHCLEVELPFLQVVAPRAKVVPILVGQGTDREMARSMAETLARLLGPTTAVVVSTDFSHHGQGYGWAPFAGDEQVADTLVELARQTAGRLAAVDSRGFWQQVEVSGDTVCGKRPLAVLEELLAHAFAGRGEVLGVTTSGHVTHSWDQSVSYVAVAFDGSWKAWQADPPPVALGTLAAADGKAILELARATLDSHLVHGPALARWFAAHPDTRRLDALAGAFVTVNNTGARARDWGKLRACMGVIEARQPLLDAVTHSAVSAAHDPRFPRLESSELDGVRLEVSVLSPTWAVGGADEIVVGTHGVVLHKDGRGAVFLPQVAPEQGWDRDTMLEHLSRKAGLPGDAWKKGATFEVFTAQVFAEDH